MHLIDTEGRERLTMRRLGSELGVEAMALYRYIPGREQLLDGVVEYIMNELYQQTMTGDLPGSWQEYLQRMAHGVRGICVAHPRVFPLVATRPPAAPWLRPPLRSLRWVEVSWGRCSTSASATTPASASTGRSPPSCSATCCSSRPQWT